MGKIKYARVRVQIKRGNLEVIGQRRTMRGVNYNKKTVRLALKGRSSDEFKRAIRGGLEQLFESSENSS